MAQRYPTLTLKNFNGGLNLRDDENNLGIRESSRIQNVQIEGSGLKKSPGWEKILNGLPDEVFLSGLYEYILPDKESRLISVTYPDIYIIDPQRGNFEYAIDSSTGDKYRGWVCTGKPFGRKAGDFFGFVDGANRPLLIDKNIVREPNWVPSYSHQNNAAGGAGDIGNLTDSYLATESNPGATTIGNPSFCVFFKNRWIINDVSNPRRLYFSKAGDFRSGNFVADMFEDNDPANFNIGFFVDVPCHSDIVGAEVISSEKVVIYCRNEILTLEGNHPPGQGYPQPHFDFDPLNEEIGALSNRLIAKKGDNDHYFVSNKNTIYEISNIDESLQVKPKGLSEQVHPTFEALKSSTLERGFLVNHRIKGELHFFFPSADNLRYPDIDYVLNYEDSADTGEPAWSTVGGFTPFRMRGVTTIENENKLIILDPTDLYEANKGITFAGNSNETIYQIPTLDFGKPLHNKRVLDITLYTSSSTGATLQFYHLWDNGKSGLTNVTIPKDDVALYGSAIYGQSTYTSKAGDNFQKTKFRLTNRVGAQLKMRLEHNSSTETFDIHKIVIRFKPLGQRN